MIDFRQIAVEAHKTSRDHGFWIAPQDSLDLKVLLIHSEISEVVEEWRLSAKAHGGPLFTPIWQCESVRVLDEGPHEFDHGLKCNGGLLTPNYHKPVGFMSELADIIIRLGDLIAHYGFPVIVQEMLADDPRPHEPTRRVNLASTLRSVHASAGHLSAMQCNLHQPALDVVVGCQLIAQTVGGDLEAAVRLKMAYNTTRPFKHGKEF